MRLKKQKNAKKWANGHLFLCKNNKKKNFLGPKTKNTTLCKTRGIVYRKRALKPLKTLGFAIEKTLKKVKKIFKKYLH